MSDFEARFSGARRLLSSEGVERLRRAHVAVVGIGGVGSWAAEALARSGLGELTLIDMDDVCVSNVNRQIHAHDPNFGRPKVEAMAERARQINPEIRAHAESEFLTESNVRELLAANFSFVIDAIDSVSSKCHLIAACRELKTPIIVAGGAGGRADPTSVRVADLARATHDRLLQKTRKTLRKEFGFPREPGRVFGVPCVFSPEAPVFPAADGSISRERDPSMDFRSNCEGGYGTVAFVTGAFGFTAAAHVTRSIARV